MADKPDLNEVATTRDGRDITRGFVGALDLLQPQDRVLTGRANGDYAIYEEVLRDDQVFSTFQQRRLAVVSREWEVVPGGDSALDQAASADIEKQLQNVHFDAVTDKMMHGVFYGFAVAECLWARDGQRVVLDAIKVRKQRRFRFSSNGELRLLTSAHPQGEALPPKKFWTYCTGADNDDEPYGLGLAHWLYWPVFFKRNGLKFWLIFLEKFGVPTVVGEYDPSASETDKDRLLAACAAVQTDSGIIIPKGMLLRLLEATRSGSADQGTFHDKMNAAISKVVLSQTMTTDDGASKAQGQVHENVKDEVVNADADLVCDSFSRGPVRWLTEWNYPGAKPPKVWRKRAEEPDLTAQSDREKTIFDMGFRPTLKHIQDTYGGEWEQAVPQPKGDPAPASFAEGEQPAKDGVDQLADQLDDAAANVLAGTLEAVKRIVAEAKTLEEVRDRILEAYGSMDVAQLGTLMQRAMVAAELMGRSEVADETAST